MPLERRESGAHASGVSVLRVFDKSLALGFCLDALVRFEEGK